MGSLKKAIESRIDPVWAAVITAVSVLYGTWPVLSAYNALVAKPGDGFGWIPFLISGPISFVIVTILVTCVLGGLFWLLENRAARSAICLVMMLVFFANHGLRHPFILALMVFFAATTYVQTRKAREDASGREEFSMDDQVRGVQVTDDFLGSFPDPLWDKLDLENCRALSAIEGWQDGYRFIILELRHRRFGLLADNGERAVTTFFVVGIPASNPGRNISWQPVGWQASVDGTYAYLAKPGEQARPKEWRQVIQLAIKTVESLKTRAETASRGGFQAPTYHPVGAGVMVNAFWAVIMLVFALLFSGTGLGMIFGLIDYRPDCFPNAAAPSCKVTTKVWRAWDAFKAGSEYLLGAGICIYGVFYSCERIRKRLRARSSQAIEDQPIQR